MKSEKWMVEHIQDLKGKVIIVTGANSGLGFEAAKVFAKKDATVILACRSITRAETAKEKIMKVYPKSQLMIIPLDLESFESIKVFVNIFQQKFTRLDVLLNNAGIMTVPYGKTEDGLERQNGINHYGHFALTAQLFPLLKKTAGSRIVNVSSVAHRMGKMNFVDPLFEKQRYSKFKSYGRSKLSNLLFTYELDRRIREKGLDIKVLAAHPGVADTSLMRYMNINGILKPLYRLFAKFINTAYTGALPEIRASVDPDVQSGTYYGPKGLPFTKKKPVVVKSNKASHRVDYALKLWELSEKITNQKFEF